MFSLSKHLSPSGPVWGCAAPGPGAEVAVVSGLAWWLQLHSRHIPHWWPRAGKWVC